MKRQKAEWGLEEFVTKVVNDGGEVKQYKVDNDTAIIHFVFNHQVSLDELSSFSRHIKEKLPGNVLALFSKKGDMEIKVDRPPPAELDFNITNCNFESEEAFAQFQKNLVRGGARVRVSMSNCRIQGKPIPEIPKPEVESMSKVMKQLLPKEIIASKSMLTEEQRRQMMVEAIKNGTTENK